MTKAIDTNKCMVKKLRERIATVSWCKAICSNFPFCTCELSLRAHYALPLIVI